MIQAYCEPIQYQPIVNLYNTNLLWASMIVSMGINGINTNIVRSEQVKCGNLLNKCFKALRQENVLNCTFESFPVGSCWEWYCTGEPDIKGPARFFLESCEREREREWRDVTFSVHSHSQLLKLLSIVFVFTRPLALVACLVWKKNLLSHAHQSGSSMSDLSLWLGYCKYKAMHLRWKPCCC